MNQQGALIDVSALREEFVGRKEEVLRCRFTVNAPMARTWCDAMGLDYRRYLGHDAANASPGAPTAMLQVWTMRGLVHAERTAWDEVRDRLTGAGYTGVVATDTELVTDRPLIEGESFLKRTRVASISDEKATSLGRGMFVSTFIDVLTEAEESVGSVMMRVLCYQPRAERG